MKNQPTTKDKPMTTTTDETSQTEQETTEPVPTQKPILIDKANDIGAFCSLEASRFTLQGIHFTKDKTVATDNKVLIEVPYSQLEVEDFPPVEVSDAFQPGVIIPAKAVKEALKTTIHKSNLPTLGCVRVASATKDKAALTTTDLDNERTLATKLIDGTYPNTEQLWAALKPPQMKVALNAKLLKKIAEYALANGKVDHKGDIAINIEIADEMSTMAFSIYLEDGRKARGLLMSMRIS